MESRAAARAMLEAQGKGVRRLQIVHCIPRPYQDNSKPHVGAWIPMIDGSFTRLLYIPSATDEEQRGAIEDTHRVLVRPDLM
jgi:hypothetical protein